MARDWYSAAVGAIGGTQTGTPVASRRTGRPPTQASSPTHSPFNGSRATSFGAARPVAHPFTAARSVQQEGRSPFTSYRASSLGARHPFAQNRNIGGGTRHPLATFSDVATMREQKRMAESMSQQGSGFGMQPGIGQTGSLTGAPATPTGGSFAGGRMDGYTNEINAAAAKYGVPANFLKAIIARESSGDWNANSHSVASVRGGAPIFGFVGVFHNAAIEWGFNPASLEGNRPGQIEMLASGLRRFYDRSPNKDWMQAASMHFSGKWQDDGYVDELGNSTGGYTGNIRQWWQQLDQMAGSQGWNPQQQPVGNPFGAPTVGGGGNAGQIISEATKWVGQVPYVWGGIPGKGQTPFADGGGWDCSGFTYWLDQNFGAGSLPMGSHYQYQAAQQDGTFINSINQLQPGDLIFFDTGNTAGGGAHLNRAGHVGMYIGNGQMVHAANPSVGTIISNLAGHYAGQFIGGKRMGWSGGSPTGVGQYGSGTMGYGQPMMQRPAGGAWWQRSLDDIIASWQSSR